MIGYECQRFFLSKKYQKDSATAHQLWSRADLQTANYNVGTQITNHLEVVAKTPDAIVVRCGDSPLKPVRDPDGLFQISASIDRDEGVAELRLKSVFWNSMGVLPPPYMEFGIGYIRSC
jgi:hypothetical protein